MDWTRKLDTPIDLGTGTLRTIADVRAHLMTLPEHYHQRPAFAYVAHLILEAARGEYDGDISVVLRLTEHALKIDADSLSARPRPVARRVAAGNHPRRRHPRQRTAD
jgi:hypothetical protein